MGDFTASDIERMFGGVDELMDSDAARRIFQVEPRCSLAADDAKAAPHQLSHVIALSMSAGLDNLHALRCLIVDVRVLHTFAPFPLLRAAFENACVAAWLLTGETRAQRILRRLRLVEANMKNSDSALKLLGKQPRRSVEERRREIREIATAAGIPETDPIKGVGFGEIVESAGTATAMNGDTAMLAWRTGSGMSHGDMWAALGLLNREDALDDGDGTVHVRVSAPDELVRDMAILTRSMLRFAASIHEKRARR